MSKKTKKYKKILKIEISIFMLFFIINLISLGYNLGYGHGFSNGIYEASYLNSVTPSEISSFSELAEQFCYENSGINSEFTRYDFHAPDSMIASCYIKRPDGFTKFDYYSWEEFCSWMEKRGQLC